MDRTKYATLISDILYRISESYIDPTREDVQTELVIDNKHGNYMLLDIGWTPDERVRRQFVYVRLKNDKFWIEEDWTEDGIVTYLEAAGVPKEDIVLAFNPPELRPYTSYAVA